MGISIDETTRPEHINILLQIFSGVAGLANPSATDIPAKMYLDRAFLRTSSFLQQDTFKKYRTETELMRYIKRLERRDISLTHSMIPLGSCTMKLNAASELLPLFNPAFQNIHPYAPVDQVLRDRKSVV